MAGRTAGGPHVGYLPQDVELLDGKIARLNGLRLVAGMPVEAFIQTGDRTVISYLVKPLHDQIVKAFRER